MARLTLEERRDLEALLLQIVEQFDQEELTASTAFHEQGTAALWGRFRRAVENQICEGEATIPRYAIWAGTIRNQIIEAMESIDSDEPEKAKQQLIRAANALAAFNEIQALFDPMEMGHIPLTSKNKDSV